MHSLRNNSSVRKAGFGEFVTKSSLLRNKQLIGTVMGWRFPAGLQVFHDTVRHPNEFFLHLKELASRIAVKIFGGELSRKRVDLAQQICCRLLVRVQDNWFQQIWKGRKGGRAGQAECGFQSEQRCVPAAFVQNNVFKVYKVFVPHDTSF